MSPAWLTQFAAGGFLQNLEEPLASSGLEDTLLPVAMLQGRMYENTAYMIGSVVDTYPLFYNTKHFEEAGLSGPPTTTEEFHDYAVRLTDVANNRYGFYQLAANPWAFQSWSTWMLNHGGIGVDNTLYDEDGKSVFRQPDQIVGLEAWADLYREAQVSPPAAAAGSFNDAANAFNAGQVSMVMGFLGYIRNFAGGIGADSFSTAITPAGPVGQYVHYAANGFCVGSQSPNQEAAWEFVQYLMTPEINGLLNQEWGAIPPVVEALEFDYLKDPVFEAPLQMVQMDEAFVHTPRQYPEWARFFQEYGPEQGQALLLGAQSAEDFANNVSESLEAMRVANEGE
jgi:multiple sugar transport system substrate-binding protein